MNEYSAINDWTDATTMNVDVDNDQDETGLFFAVKCGFW